MARLVNEAGLGCGRSRGHRLRSLHRTSDGRKGPSLSKAGPRLNPTVPPNLQLTPASLSTSLPGDKSSRPKNRWTRSRARYLYPLKLAHVCELDICFVTIHATIATSRYPQGKAPTDGRHNTWHPAREDHRRLAFTRSSISVYGSTSRGGGRKSHAAALIAST